MDELVMSLEQKIKQLTTMLKIKDAALDRYRPCPDCRDKVKKNECLRCRVQYLERKLQENNISY